MWIEIESPAGNGYEVSGRPLHRGCGLKYGLINFGDLQLIVALFTEGVD